MEEDLWQWTECQIIDWMSALFCFTTKKKKILYNSIKQWWWRDSESWIKILLFLFIYFFLQKSKRLFEVSSNIFSSISFPSFLPTSMVEGFRQFTLKNEQIALKCTAEVKARLSQKSEEGIYTENYLNIIDEISSLMKFPKNLSNVIVCFLLIWNIIFSKHWFVFLSSFSINFIQKPPELNPTIPSFTSPQIYGVINGHIQFIKTITFAEKLFCKISVVHIQNWKFGSCRKILNFLFIWNENWLTSTVILMNCHKILFNIK